METNRIKKVLIALDYDPTAQKIAETGYFLAKAMDAQVVLLHVISDHLHYSSMEFTPIMGYTGFLNVGQFQYDNLEQLKKESKNFLAHTVLHLGDKNVQTAVFEGDFAETILAASKQLEVDVIVMGTHSRKWLENIVMGSVTEKVLRKSTIPLFIVPTRKVNN